MKLVCFVQLLCHLQKRGFFNVELKSEVLQHLRGDQCSAYWILKRYKEINELMEWTVLMANGTNVSFRPEDFGQLGSAQQYAVYEQLVLWIGHSLVHVDLTV